ncbi:MAG: mucoidy inhibitor MuiA family protein [Pseudohongiellaceae bacterium]
MKINLSLCNLIATLSLASSIGAVAAELETTTTITHVTVSQGSAVVTRSGSISIPAGQHSLIVKGLPGQLDLGRLQLALNNREARLGNIHVEREDQSTLVGESQQQLQDQLNDLLYQRGGIDDEIASARMQIQLLNSLSNGELGSQQAAVSVSDVGEMLSIISASSNEARLLIRNAQREAAALDIEIEQIKRRLAEFSTRNRFFQKVTAAVEIENPSELNFTLSYPVNGARWSWLYEARLNTDTNFLELERKVSVNQTSGENWTDVNLTITTASSNARITPPELDSLLVDIRPEPKIAQNRSFVTGASVQSSGGLGARLNAPQAVMEDFVEAEVDIDASAYLVNFQIPGQVTLNRGGDQQIFPIDSRGITVDLVARTMPMQDQTAYLEARFVLEDEQPIQAGRMQFYRDGGYIGGSMISGFLPQEDVRLPFGADERIRIEVLPDAEESDAGSTFRRNAVDNRRQRFMISSFHETPKAIEIVAQLPVSQNEDIQVVLDDDATPADEDSFDDKTGLLLWERQASAGEPLVIRHNYSIRYPKDAALYFRN